MDDPAPGTTWSTLWASARSVVDSPALTVSDADRQAADEHLRDGVSALQRDGGPVHVTASLFLFDPTLTRVALVFHRKGRFWVQPGGHLEDGDVDVESAALRELQEETGVLPDRVRSVRAVDLDHHVLVGSFGRCTSHLDIGVAGIADDEPTLTTSDESETVGWFDIAALPSPAARGQAERVAAIRRRMSPEG